MTDPLFTPLTPANPAAPKPRKCRRHEWVRREVVYAINERVDVFLACSRCGAAKDPATATRNRRNRSRGNRTSHDLAVYLGGRSVEALGEKWDVEAPGCRLQSKRLATAPSLNATAAILDAIGPSDDLRGFYLVRPRERLASGRVFVWLTEWAGWHGWTLPRDAALLNAGRPLLSLPLSTFRDLHVKEKVA